jgi:hypothetical protein
LRQTRLLPYSPMLLCAREQAANPRLVRARGVGVQKGASELGGSSRMAALEQRPDAQELSLLAEHPASETCLVLAQHAKRARRVAPRQGLARLVEQSHFCGYR